MRQQMSVSNLLQRVQVLTEEGNAVEEEIRAADGAISKCKAETDVIKQQCINTEKEIQEVTAADNKQMIASFVNWECIRFSLFIVESSV